MSISAAANLAEPSRGSTCVCTNPDCTQHAFADRARQIIIAAEGIQDMPDIADRADAIQFLRWLAAEMLDYVPLDDDYAD
jgi:hypothetical protein